MQVGLEDDEVFFLSKSKAPFLDSANQATFLRPLLYAEDPEQTAAKIPNVRMRMREKDKLRFLALYWIPRRGSRLPGPLRCGPGLKMVLLQCQKIDQGIAWF